MRFGSITQAVVKVRVASVGVGRRRAFTLVLSWPTMSIERRVHTRHSAAGAVECQVEGERGPLLLEAKPIDLSTSGVCLSMDRKLRVGDRMRLAFTSLSSTEVFRIQGIVRWVAATNEGDWRIGCQFDNLVPLDRLVMLLM